MPNRPSTQGRNSTAARGYGGRHQALRRQLLRAFTPGDPCARCNKPMLDATAVELDHTNDRNGYLGLSHKQCNRSHGGHKSHRHDTRTVHGNDAADDQDRGPGFWFNGHFNHTSTNW